MRVLSIESESNPLVKKVRGLRTRSGRRKAGLFLLEGDKVIREAIHKGVELVDLIVSKSCYQRHPLGSIDQIGKIAVADDRLFGALSDTSTPQEMMATARFLTCSLDQLIAATDPLIVMLDGVQDPGNLGTIFRTSLCLSASGLILGKGCVDPYNPKVVRSASGAIFGLPFVTGLELGTAVDLCRRKQIRLVSTSATATDTIHQTDLTGSICLIFGSEGQGISRQLADKVDSSVSIPISDSGESLNVAVAHAVALYETAMQRSGLGRQKS